METRLSESVVQVEKDLLDLQEDMGFSDVGGKPPIVVDWVEEESEGETMNDIYMAMWKSLIKYLGITAVVFVVMLVLEGFGPFVQLNRAQIFEGKRIPEGKSYDLAGSFLLKYAIMNIPSSEV